MYVNPTPDRIEHLFESSYKAMLKRRSYAVISGSLTALAGFTLLFLLLEYLFFLSPPVKSALWIFVATGTATMAWYLKIKTNVPDYTSFYRTVSDRTGFPEVRYVLDFLRQPEERETDLTQAAIRQNLQKLDEREVSAKIADYLATHPVTRVRNRMAFSGSIMLLLLIAAIYNQPDSLYRSGAFWISYQAPIPYEFAITPGDTTMEQGSAFQATVSFYGAVPEQVRIGMQTSRENKPRIQGMVSRDGALYQSREIELFEDLEFFVEMDGYRSDRKKIRVELLPRLQDLTLYVHTPDYTGMEPAYHVYPFNHIEAVRGSTVHLRARSNKPLEVIDFLSSRHAEPLPLSVDSVISTEFQALEDDVFHFHLQDKFHLVNNNPFRFRMTIIQDQPPRVEILSPEARIHQVVNESLPLLYEYSDDFGFTRVELRYRLYRAFVDTPKEGVIALPVPGRNRGLAEFDWELGSLSPGPMDRLEYWIEVTDNNAFDGYQTARSSIHTIEIPSLASRFFDQEEREQEIDRQFSGAEQSYQQIQDEMDRLRESIRSRPDDDWEHSRILDELREQRGELEKQMEELRSNFDELTRDIRDQNLLSEETLLRYQELQQLIHEIDDPEILRLLEEMQSQLNHLDQGQLREYLESMEFNEERYRERLERTMNLFRTLRLYADLESMSKLLDDLQEQENRLSEQESYGGEEIRQQQQIQEQIEQLINKMEDLPGKNPQRNLEDFSQSIVDQMDALQQMIEENIQQMQNMPSDSESIRSGQQDISQEMGDLSDLLSGLLEQMQQKAITINTQSLRYILETLLLLSTEQERVLAETGELAANSPGFIDQARRQRNISGQFEMITDSLYRVSAEIPRFSNRINDRKHEIHRHMERATRYLIDRNRNQASAQERSALGGLNEIGTMVADLLDQLNQMDQGGDGSPMSMDQIMEQMQGMSQDQQQLNQQIQDFINDLQGERLTQDHMQRLEQMARQQYEIREKMNRLRNRSGLQGDRLMSEMERLSEQMEDAINDMRGGSTDRLMVERQQNILSRMLEVEKSVHQREEDDERRLGETAGDHVAREAAPLTMDELRQLIRSGAEQTHYTRFKDEYQRLIELYFRFVEELLESPDSSGWNQ